MRVAVEVCATTIAEVAMAASLEADTVELCVSLDEGGVTPSHGLIQAALAICGDRLRVLIRPRPGSFVYEEQELGLMRADILHALGTGCRRLVTGALSPSNELAVKSLHGLMEGSEGAEWTMHRGFDAFADQDRALDLCIQLGFRRVLTSGGGEMAAAGMNGLRSLVRASNGKLQIAAAGGIGPSNVVRLVEFTGVTEVHFSARRMSVRNRADSIVDSLAFGADWLPDERKVIGVMEALTKAGLR